MKRVRLVTFIISGALMCLLCAPGVWAALVKTDLIGGLGEFEWSAETRWQIVTDNGWPIGVNDPAPDDSVATGWYRRTLEETVPAQNIICRIEPGTGLKGSHSQYMALRACRKSARASLGTAVMVDDNRHSTVHHGDTLTFKLDRSYMTGYSLPAGASVTYDIRIYFGMVDAPDEIHWNYLTASTTPFSAEVTTTVPAGATFATCMVDIWAEGDLGAAVPGIHIDGARLYRKPAGSSEYEMERIPILQNRPIRTLNVHYVSSLDDPYDIAVGYDAVLMNQIDGPAMLRLKYYRPDISLYLYEFAGGVSDAREPGGADGYYVNCPLQMSRVLADHLDWLYPWPEGWTPQLDSRPSWAQDISCVYDPQYQSSYYAHVDNPDYQQAWARATAELALRYRADGAFIDGLGGVSHSVHVPFERAPIETQSFEHAVYPYLRQSGLQIVMNQATAILSKTPDSIYFNPFWKTDATFSPGLGYESNTPANTPDVFLMEWGFFRHWPIGGVDANRYELSYWLSTLDNMDKIAAWNKRLSSRLRKSIVVIINGLDNPGDPFGGLNGWAHFGLCSYLLGQTQYTLFGANLLNGHDYPMDLNGVSRLGSAVSGRGPLKSDSSLQLRYFRNGIVIVNAHPAASATYRLPIAVIDENGVRQPRSTIVTLLPHTGRMFFYR